MKESTFRQQLRKAEQEETLFAEGYRRGLRRHFYGERFGTAEAHASRMEHGKNGDYRTELGDGYRSGFAGEFFNSNSE
jgi:hypothetical protein